MGVSARIYYDAVCLIKICLLDIIDQVTLMVALEALDLNALAPAVGSDHGDQVIVSRSTVDIGLPDAEHIEVWSVKYKYLHIISASPKYLRSLYRRNHSSLRICRKRPCNHTMSHTYPCAVHRASRLRGAARSVCSYQ